MVVVVVWWLGTNGRKKKTKLSQTSADANQPRHDLIIAMSSDRVTRSMATKRPRKDDVSEPALDEPAPAKAQRRRGSNGGRASRSSKASPDLKLIGLQRQASPARDPGAKAPEVLGSRSSDVELEEAITDNDEAQQGGDKNKKYVQGNGLVFATRQPTRSVLEQARAIRRGYIQAPFQGEAECG